MCGTTDKTARAVANFTKFNGSLWLPSNNTVNKNKFDSWGQQCVCLCPEDKSEDTFVGQSLKQFFVRKLSAFNVFQSKMASKDHPKKDCCKEGTKSADATLVKVTEVRFCIKNARFQSPLETRPTLDFILSASQPQLPIYGNPHPFEDVIQEPSKLEEEVRKVRLTTTQNLSFLADWVNSAKQFGQSSLEQITTTYGSITDEKNAVGKAAFITGGGLIGLTIRRGLLRKLIYSTVGIVTTAAICYPEKAKENANVGFYIAINKLNPIIQEYTGVDVKQEFDQLTEKAKSLVSSAKKQE